MQLNNLEYNSQRAILFIKSRHNLIRQIMHSVSRKLEPNMEFSSTSTLILPFICFFIGSSVAVGAGNNKNQSISKKKWPRGVVPYLFDPVSKFSQSEKLVVEKAMDRIRLYSGCITFTEISAQRGGDRVVVTSHGLAEVPGKGCWAHEGRQGGVQALNLDEGCITLHGIEKQLFQVLGVRSVILE